MEEIILFEWESAGFQWRMTGTGTIWSLTSEGWSPIGGGGPSGDGFLACAVELYKLKQAYQAVLAMVPDAD